MIRLSRQSLTVQCARNDKDYNEVIKCVNDGLEKADIRKLHLEHPTKELMMIWPCIGVTKEYNEPLVTVGVHRIFIPRLARKKILENLHLLIWATQSHSSSQEEGTIGRLSMRI